MPNETDYIIIGAGLTGLTAAFALQRKGYRVTLLERADRAGGQIRTYSEAGYTFESGPNTGVIASPEVAELFEALRRAAGRDLLQRARPEARRRLIWKGGRWRAIPNGAKTGLLSSLVTLRDKFGVLLEPWRPKGGAPDESIAETARRRLGRSFVDYFVDPFISGIYAGDAERIVTRYALPKLYALEQEHGSFVRGALAKRRRRRAMTPRERLATREVFSVSGGMQTLTDTLASLVGRDLLLRCASLEVRPCREGWAATFAQDGVARRVMARKVITTTPAYALPSLLPFLTAADLAPITAMRYAPVVQICVGMRRVAGQDFRAFGGLVPTREEEDILGVLFPSSCFEGRAPEEGVLLSFFLGGVKKPHLVEQTDEELMAIVTDALHRILGFPEGQRPDVVRIFRHARAIPQYEASTAQRLACVAQLQERHSGLLLAGNLRDGVGLANRISQGQTVE